MMADARPLAASLPVSLQLLITAAESRGTATLNVAPPGPAGWDVITAAAHRHGLSALLPDALARFAPPAAVRERAAAVARDQVVAGLRGMAEVIQACDTLRHVGIRSVVLKGPALSRWLYGTVGFRRFADLDIVVASRQMGAARAALEREGYSLPAGMSASTAEVIYRGLGAWPLGHPDRYPVDLHFRLAHRSFASPLTSEELMATSIEDGGPNGVHIPCATHAALVLLLHASKHLWCTLEMVLAIARVMERTDVDWARVRALAQRSGSWTGCRTGLVLAQGLFGTAIPADAIDRPGVGVPDKLRRFAVAALLRPGGAFADRWEERRAHRASLDRWTGRVRYDIWRVAAPTPLEWQWWPLPDRLGALYTPLRLLRLAANAARGTLDGDAAAISGTATAPVPPDGGATRSTHAGRASRRTSG